MARTKALVTRFLFLAFLGSFLLFPTVEALPYPFAGDVYFAVGDEQGGRYLVKSNGNGTFGAVGSSFMYGDNNRGGALEDFDEDGDLDFVGCNDDASICHLFSQSTPGVFIQGGSLSAATALSGVEAGMAADDFNQDGHADVLLGGNQNVASIYYGDGVGAFPTVLANLLPTASVSAYKEKDSGDLDGNGYPDIILALGGGEVYSYLNTAGTFTGPNFLFDASALTSDGNALATADFDGDGFLDIVAGGDTGGIVSLYKGNGTGNSASSFMLVGTVYDFDTQSAVDSYDFDNDGDQDLVAVKRSTGEVFHFAGNGDGTFQAAVLLGTVTPSAFGMATPPAPPIRSVVKGVVWSDTTPNGVQSGTESGLAGASLTLTGTDFAGHTVSMSTTSTAGGSYKFTRVPISNSAGFTLGAVTLSGHTATTTTTRTVSLPKENTTVTENFGYVPHSTVSVKVFNDVNGNGVDDSEAGIGGVTLQLSDTDFNGTTILKTATTDTNGNAVFTALDPSGSIGYTLTVLSPPAGFEATTPEFSNVTILTGGSSPSRSFGYKALPLPGTIQGYVFNDADISGIKEGTEGGFAGIVVTLTGKTYKNVTVNETRITDANGAYSFASIDVPDANGYTLSTALVPNSIATTSVSTTIFLEPEQTVSYDFGFKPNPPPDPDDDDDGVSDSADICSGSVSPEQNVPSERLLPNHHAQMDNDAALEVGLSNGSFADSTFTMSQTKGCTCEQILNNLPGKRNGQYKFGCPKGIVEEWISSH